MKNKNTDQEVKVYCENSSCGRSDAGNAVYGLGVIGALVYFFPEMVSVSTVILSVIKSIFWPAILVFEALSLLNL